MYQIKRKQKKNVNNHCCESPWLWSLGSAITKLGAKQIKGARLNGSGEIEEALSSSSSSAKRVRLRG